MDIMRRAIFVLLCLGCINCLQAQNFNQQVFSSNGGNNKDNSVNLDWSIGQVINTTVVYKDGILTQGFLQPELIDVSREGSDNSVISFMNISPNPTNSVVSVSFSKEQLAKADNFKIFNSVGELVKIQTAQNNEKNRIDLQDQSDGIYYILLFDSVGNKLDQGQIIKIN